VYQRFGVTDEVDGDLLIAVQSPLQYKGKRSGTFHILADETLHQLGVVGLDEPA